MSRKNILGEILNYVSNSQNTDTSMRMLEGAKAFKQKPSTGTETAKEAFNVQSKVFASE